MIYPALKARRLYGVYAGTGPHGQAEKEKKALWKSRYRENSI